jgi:hypothetical protein
MLFEKNFVMSWGLLALDRHKVVLMVLDKQVPEDLALVVPEALKDLAVLEVSVAKMDLMDLDGTHQTKLMEI